MLAVCWLAFTLDAEAKTLYVCDDGRTVLFTDRAELGCPVYTPKAELIIVPDGATWADVKAAVAAVESEAFQPQAKSSKAMRTEEAREDRCQWWSVIGSSLTDGCDGDVPSSGWAQGLSVKKAQ